MELGRIGVFGGWPLLAAPAEGAEAIAEIEELGYSAFWFGELGEAFTHAALLLAWSSRLVIANGIVNIYARDAAATARAAKILAAAYPGRYVLGLGVSHAPLVAARGHEYGRPVTTMRAYLDEVDATPYAGAEPERPVPRVLAALGPRMLELAAERADGAHPVFVPVEHTVFARERLGPDKLLAVDQAFVLTGDEEEARRAASGYLRALGSLDNYRRNLERFGVDDRNLFERIVAWGDVDAVVARVRAHLDAGASHVCVRALPDDAGALEQLRRVAPALLAL